MNAEVDDSKKIVSDPAKEYKYGDKVILMIDDEIVECTLVDFSTFDFSDSNPEVRMMRKAAIPMRVSVEGETLEAKQDGASPVTIGPGYPIIKNPGEAEYPFMDDEESPENALARFYNTYWEEESGSNEWVKGPFRVIPVSENIAIRPSWDAKGLMGTKAGGVVAEGGYTITSRSIAGNADVIHPTYEIIDEELSSPK